MIFALVIWLSLFAVLHAGKLEFKETFKDVHAPADVNSVAAEFEFTNKTDKEVSISKYESTCSCMAVGVKGGKLRYAPGESGLIRAEFDMGNFSGEIDKIINLYLDDAPLDKPSVKLTVRVHIPVLINLEPKTLKWDLAGKGEPQTIKITMNHTKPVKVTKITCSSEAFKTELKTVSEGKVYDLVVTPVAVDKPSLAILRLETDCDIAKHRTQQGFAVVRKPTPAEAAAVK
jgi:hypothetical protein